MLPPLRPEYAGRFWCGNPACGVLLVKCSNYRLHQVCNRGIVCGQSGQPVEPLCGCCRYNSMVPDLSVPGNHLRWYRLEAAKRRLFYGLDLLRLPYGNAADGFHPPLSFAFMADDPAAESVAAGAAKVVTGHAQGRITINLSEADDVERERQRVKFGEAHRTLIGHFRHEIGHYYWEVGVRGRRESACRELFGDHTASYADALQRYYRDGAPNDWPQRCVSAYAAMHPWEDFAETFSTYLSMVCVNDTAAHQGLCAAWSASEHSLDTLVQQYQRVGIVINEMNRTLGLLDLMAEIFVHPVIEKLRFIHNLVGALRQVGPAHHGFSTAAFPDWAATGGEDL